VQLELIAEIHRTAIWPVVINVDGNISMPEISNFIDRDGSYIILLPDNNIWSVHAEIAGLIQDRKNEFTILWNSEVRFVVAGANEFSMLQQMRIFYYFSKFRIYNFIFVSKKRDLLHKKYSRPVNVNDVDTGMKLVVYTWFPYQSSDRCAEVSDITLLDSWVISAQGHFTNNTDLFPGKFSNSFKGCPMKVLIFDSQFPFASMYKNVRYSKGAVVSPLGGSEMALLSIVLQQMNMTFIPVHTPEDIEKKENSLNNVVKLMFLRECDIIVGNFLNNLFNEKFLSSTNYYDILTVSWYVPCSEKYPRWSSIFRILSVELSLVLIISIVIMTILTTLVGRYNCTSESQGYKTLKSSFTNLWAVILGVSVSSMPRTVSLRSLFFTWVFFCLAFNTVFQAFLTSFLTDSGYKTPIKDMDELFATGINPAYPQSDDILFVLIFGMESLQIKKIM